MSDADRQAYRSKAVKNPKKQKDITLLFQFLRVHLPEHKFNLMKAKVRAVLLSSTQEGAQLQRALLTEMIAVAGQPLVKQGLTEIHQNELKEQIVGTSSKFRVV
jgi:hypothetical protein